MHSTLQDSAEISYSEMLTAVCKMYRTVPALNFRSHLFCMWLYAGARAVELAHVGKWIRDKCAVHLQQMDTES